MEFFSLGKRKREEEKEAKRKIPPRLRRVLRGPSSTRNGNAFLAFQALHQHQYSRDCIYGCVISISKAKERRKKLEGGRERKERDKSEEPSAAFSLSLPKNEVTITE